MRRRPSCPVHWITCTVILSASLLWNLMRRLKCMPVCSWFGVYSTETSPAVSAHLTHVTRHTRSHSGLLVELFLQEVHIFKMIVCLVHWCKRVTTSQCRHEYRCIALKMTVSLGAITPTLTGHPCAISPWPSAHREPVFNLLRLETNLHSAEICCKGKFVGHSVKIKVWQTRHCFLPTSTVGNIWQDKTRRDRLDLKQMTLGPQRGARGHHRRPRWDQKALFICPTLFLTFYV